jgi:hypothetical protein
MFCHSKMVSHTIRCVFSPNRSEPTLHALQYQPHHFAEMTVMSTDIAIDIVIDLFNNIDITRIL